MKAVSDQIVKQNVGSDISKDAFDCSFQQVFIYRKSRIKASGKFKNTINGFKKFVTWVEKHRQPNVPVRITLEATGVYYEQLVHYLHDHTDYHISVVLPNTSKAFMKSLNIKSKTDKIDAKGLAIMGLERDLKQWKPISPIMRQLKQLTRDRTGLMSEKTALLNKRHALQHAYQPDGQAIQRLNQRIELLKAQIKEVEKQIEQVIKSDKYVAERVEKICKAKGLGIITVIVVIAETDAFNLFTSIAQLISYAGYDIVEKQSGSSINGKTRISKKGNKHIRRALYFPAITIVKYDDEFKNLYDRVHGRTKIKMKGYVAVQRKLLVIIYTLFKKNEAYDPNYRKDGSDVQQKDGSQEKKASKKSRQDVMPAYAG